MAESKNNTLGFTGRIRGAGVTFYRLGGKTYARISTRTAPNMQSVKQFINRERMRHSIALWHCFYSSDKPLMETSGGLTAYNAFLRANSALPTVYFTKQQARQGAALLMPGMVVSEGRLPAVEYDFAVLESGERVVLTNLLTGIEEGETQELAISCNDDLRQLLCSSNRNPQLMSGDKVRFYRFEQRLQDDCPKAVPTTRTPAGQWCCSARRSRALRHRGSSPLAVYMSNTPPTRRWPKPPRATATWRNPAC